MSTETPHIAEGLQQLAVPVDSLTPDPGNVRLHDARNLRAIMDSLSKFGQRQPIVVQRQGMVVRAGNGRLAAAKQLGWTEIAAVVVDEDNVSATAFALADNRSAELAAWDFEGLADTLKELSAASYEIDDLGWSSYELEPMLEATWSPPAVDDDFDNAPPSSSKADPEFDALLAAAMEKYGLDERGTLMAALREVLGV